MMRMQMVGVIRQLKSLFQYRAKHGYSVGSDYNHIDLTQYFTKRVIKHWIEEYKIDGIRWDLTKVSQNCGPNDDECANNYQSDRVAVPKNMQIILGPWSPDQYVILNISEEIMKKRWANIDLMRIKES